VLGTRTVSWVDRGQMPAKGAAKAGRGDGPLAGQALGEFMVVGRERGFGVAVVGHWLKSGERGLRERARRYAATEALGCPASASRREYTSHVCQFAGSSRVAWRAAAAAPVRSCWSSSTRAVCISGEAAPGSSRIASRASASAADVFPALAAAWLLRTALVAASGTPIADDAGDRHDDDAGAHRDRGDAAWGG
jgi:hypothetical protein